MDLVPPVPPDLYQLLHVQEAERRRIALNLHDQLGQQLTALRLKIGALRTVLHSPHDLPARIDELEQLAIDLDRDIDFLTWELRPAALEGLGLDEALSIYVRRWSEITNVAAEFHNTDTGGPRLPVDVELHLYRIAQEALHNVSKHAGATHASVLRERHGDHITLIIEDNGRGFDAGRAPAAGGTGLGLVGLRERAALIGGAVEIQSGRGKGTTVFVRVPIKAAPPTES